MNCGRIQAHGSPEQIGGRAPAACRGRALRRSDQRVLSAPRTPPPRFAPAACSPQLAPPPASSNTRVNRACIPEQITPPPAPAAAQPLRRYISCRRHRSPHSARLLPTRSHHTTMAAKFLVLVACVALAQAGMVRRDAPSVLEEIQRHAAEFGKTFNEGFAKISHHNTHHLTDTLKKSSESVLQQIQAFSNSLQGALSDANGQVKQQLELTKTNLERVAEDLRKRHPEVERSANGLREKLQVAVSNTISESQKLAKAVGENIGQTNEKLAPQLKSAYEAFVHQAEEVQKKISDAADKH